MTLLNSALAWGALALAIPLAIHLLFRNRFRTIDWGAMHLLDEIVQVHHRRIQWQQLLLLLVRCSIPVLLAFCLARPVITWFRPLPGDAPQSLILAIDDSRSMSAVDATGQSRIDRGLHAAQTILTDLNRNDEVIVVRSSQLGELPAFAGPAEASEKLRRVVATSGPVDLAQLFSQSLAAANQASHHRRRIIILSDFQAADLNDRSLENLRRIGTRFSSDDPPAHVACLNVSGQSESLENVFVESIAVDSPAVVTGREARLTARIQNNGDHAQNRLRIAWTVDGHEIESSVITIDARSSATVRVDHIFSGRDVAELALAVEHQDAIAADNRRSIGVDVVDDVSVQIVNGQPSEQPLKGESDFLAMALSPFAFGNVDRGDAIRTKVVGIDQAIASLNQSPPNVLILANVGRLSGELKSVVADYVVHGGSLVLFDGELVQVDSYNTKWSGKESSWRLPASLGMIIGDPPTATSTPIAINTDGIAYSPWQELDRNGGSLLDSVDLFRHRKLLIETDSEQHPRWPSRRLLQTESGDPLILSADRGRGRIVQFAFPCDTDWSDLPLRPVFVPMMQQLVLDMVGSQTESTLELGEPLALAIEPWVPGDGTESGWSFSVQHPDGSNEPLTPEPTVTGGQLRFRPLQVGAYRFEATPTVPTSDVKPVSTIRIVEIPPLESELQNATPKRLDVVAESLQAKFHNSVADLQQADHTDRYGREIWRWLLGVLLITLVIEMILQQGSNRGGSLVRRHRTGIGQVAP